MRLNWGKQGVYLFPSCRQNIYKPASPDLPVLIINGTQDPSPNLKPQVLLTRILLATESGAPCLLHLCLSNHLCSTLASSVEWARKRPRPES